MSQCEPVIIGGVEYVPKSPPPAGKRAVVVVDRGWIFAGDVEYVNDPVKGLRIVITRAVWVFRWESVGFDGVLANPKDNRVTIKKLNRNVDMPADAEVFCVPVDDNWGL